MSTKEERKQKLPAEEIEVCKRLGFARKSSGLNQEELAVKAGLTRSKLANIESGRSLLRFAQGWRICGLLDVNPLWLATGESVWKPNIPLDLQPFSGLAHSQESFRNVVVGPLHPALRARSNFIQASSDLNRARTVVASSYVDALEGLLRAMVVKVPEELRDQFFDELYIAAKDFIHRISQGEGGYYEVTPSALTLQIDAKRLASFEMQKSERLEHLLYRVNCAVEKRGQKAALARFLNVPPQRVREWLAGERAPGGETTLRLLEWVTAAETKQKTPASVETTRKGEQTRTRKHTNESNPGPPRRK